MFKSYTDVRDWLENFIPQTYSKENLGLNRIRYLLKLLGNPQNKFKSIHIAGTSGKSSTAFFLARLLQGSSQIAVHSSQKKIKVGLHVSPHLAYIGERMQINPTSPSTTPKELRGSRRLRGASGGPAPAKRLIKLMSQIRPIVEKMTQSHVGLPSYFEILVAASFKYFADEKVDWAVVEVGLGGRLDATNVLKPEICVITNVGLDHTDILGKTLEKIAFEKAGIIKRSVPVVTGASGKALQIIEKVAEEKKASLIKVESPNKRFVSPVLLRKINTQLRVELPKSDIKDYLIKYYDIERYIKKNSASTNFLFALATVLGLGFRPTGEAVEKVSKEVFPGRFEVIEEGVILDGAHNPDKIRFLIDLVRESKATFRKKTRSKRASQKSKVILVVAFKKGKDWKKMVDLLLKNLRVREVIATQFQTPTDTGFFEAVSPYEIKDYIIHNSRFIIPDVELHENSQEAVFEGLKTKGEMANGVLLVTGSLYLVGEARTIWHLPEF